PCRMRIELYSVAVRFNGSAWISRYQSVVTPKMIAVLCITRVKMDGPLQARDFRPCSEHGRHKKSSRRQQINQAERNPRPNRKSLPRSRVKKYLHMVQLE